MAKRKSPSKPSRTAGSKKASSRSRTAARLKTAAAARPKPAASRPKVAAVQTSAPPKTSVSRIRAARPAEGKPSESARPSPPSAARITNAIGMVNHHLDYTSHDMEGVRRFYTDVLGFTESRLDPQVNYLFVRTGSSSSLGFMPPMPGPPEQWRPPREPALYFMVDDVDRVHRELSDRGVLFDQGPTDMPWGHRLALLRDPEGRRVCLAQNLAAPD